MSSVQHTSIPRISITYYLIIFIVIHTCHWSIVSRDSIDGEKFDELSFRQIENMENAIEDV